MPEIKDTTKTDIIPNTQEKLFELPNRRRYSLWHFTVPILLIAALVSGWFAHALIPNATAPEAQIISQNQETAEKQPADTNAYYLVYRNNLSGSGVNSLYQYAGNSIIPDVKIADLSDTSLSVHGEHFETGKYLISVNDSSNIEVLDTKTGKVEILLTMEEQGYIRDTAISSNKQWLAYGVTYVGNPYVSDLWLYNFQTKEKKQLVKKTELNIYQGFSVLGWRNDDQELIVSALGGDAGAVWGDIYQITVATGALTKIAPASTAAMPYFIRGVLSPNKNVWLYTFCAVPEKNPESQFAASEPCTSGTEIRTYDFTTKETKTVFHNLRYENNINKNELRSVLSMQWQNDKTIIVAIPGAIIELEANAKDKVTDLLTLDNNDPSEFKNNYISIFAVSPGRIVFLRENGANIFDRVSKKVEALNTEARSESFTNWLD